ncbi:hypothetical protein FOA43_004649 [Brettanomyces nanus]|uniref:Uncharacterized protein n=1 Tax=Eeniella nana TaxID=13502 RepID=A0A875SC23_EENNA|nr:uncharacterized protein FOA43_004649 [Brettanomyces nanus]QPG77242.1 hypothetical protein FOA43_004649 [Brettanomyces nanus]
MPENKSGSSSKSNATDDQKNEKKALSEIVELLKLTKPELRTLLFAMLFLCISSAVSMLFPIVLGKVIDTAKTDIEKEEISTETKVGGIPMPSAIKIFDYDVPTAVFYSALALVFLVGASANFGRIVLLRKVGERIMMNLRVNILRKIFFQDAKFWDYHKSGDLISRLVNDSTVVSRSVTQNVSDGLRSLISGFVGMSMMLAISAKLTAYMLLIFPVLLFLALVFGRKVKRVSRDIQSQLGSLTKVSEEQFSFVKTIQSFNNEEYEVGKFRKEVKKLYDLSVFEGKLNGLFYGVNGFIGNTFLLFMLSLGTYMVRQGDLSIGELSSYLMYTIYSASSVYSLSNFYSELMKGVGASGRVFELLHLKPAIDPKRGERLNVNGDIQFDHIEFRYPTRPKHAVFKDLNLYVQEGDHICLVGPSGCGKSTVAQLLLRYYFPNRGTIIANDHELDEVSLAFYRNQVGIVQQEPMLFSGTLRENIVYGRRDASKEEVRKVCDLAYCSDFIKGFSEGLDTVIGSKGAQLSGGQKQRVALARTLLLASNVSPEVADRFKLDGNSDVFDDQGNILLGPSILILDEATSALDAHSEEAIRNTLNLRQEAGLTTISIAHRLSTIEMSNKIVVFNAHGEIVEQGEFDTLISDPNSEFNKLLKKTSTGDNVEEI